ncbi:TadE family type IV pilus minor pilin [Salininema proteolyticum]|uniref:TadE family type IV pilus minor pilin n=1 Tax=Salininema proteolyticum TaxID=1607685 RepID=A0ABV8TXC6_9ACTN
MVTGELAVSLLAVVLTIGLAMWAQGAIGTKIQAIDTAHVAALAAARGDDPQAATESQRPPGASVSVQKSDRFVHVRVRATVRPFGPLTPSIDTVAEATSVRQDLQDGSLIQ